MKNEMPDCPVIEYCHCYPKEEEEARSHGTTRCVCSESEKALRGWLNGRIKTPMTPEQRQWCYQEIGSVEGYEENDYKNSTDADLAMGVLSAWTDYCQDKGLL